MHLPAKANSLSVQTFMANKSLYDSTFHIYNIHKKLWDEHGHIDHLKNTYAWVTELLPPGSEEVPLPLLPSWGDPGSWRGPAPQQE